MADLQTRYYALTLNTPIVLGASHANVLESVHEAEFRNTLTVEGADASTRELPGYQHSTDGARG